MSLLLSELSLIYFLCFISNIYIGYTEAGKIDGSFTSLLFGLTIGLFISVACLCVYRLSNFIWVYAQENKTKSLGAVIGVSYFIFSIACLLISVLFTANFTKHFLS